MLTRLRLAAILALAGMISACSSGNDNSNPAGPSTSSSISIVAGASTLSTTAYNPDTIVISKGTTVTWKNNDITTHTSTDDGGMWSSGGIAPGGSFSATLQTAGTFTYHCTIHPGMVGTITVQ
jgi:plastocyanin